VLSWDLHVHPGTSAEGRWGDGRAVQDAARRAGVRGFVWKSHSGSTAAAAADLPPGPPHVIPSIVLNHQVSPDDLERALRQGVRWIWGPSRQADGALGWELPLPPRWAAIRRILTGIGASLVLATSHLDTRGRREFASLPATAPSVLCTVTHSLYLADDEVRALARSGAVFEADLFTLTRPVRDVPIAALGPRADLVHSVGSVIYLTSDAGQAAVGDPYAFVDRELRRLAAGLADAGLADVLPGLTIAGPERVARHIRTDDATAGGGR
jgi:Family of unknown function (DUF6282)